MTRISALLAMVVLATVAFGDTRTVPADVFQINVVGNHVTLDAPSVSGNYGLHFGSAQGGANTCLLNDGSGNLSWLTAASANTASALMQRDGSGNADVSQMTFEGSSSGSTVVAPAATASGTLTLPAITDTLVSRQSTDTGANRLKNKDLSSTSVDFVDATDTTKTLLFSLSGATTGKSMTLSTAQTNNDVLTLPDATDTLVARVTTDTLQNKSMSGTQNTFTNIPLSSAVSGQLPVGNGGTGDSTLASNGVLYGNGTSAVQVTAQGAANSVLTANAGAPAFSQNPVINTSATIGVNASQTGSLLLANGGAGGNSVTVQNPAATSAYNFNLPASAGTSGQPLLSGGGASSAMTFGTLGVGAGGTGLTSGTSGGVPYYSSSSALTSSGALTSNGVVLGGGAGGAPTATAAPSQYNVLVGNGSAVPVFGQVSLNQGAAVTGTLATGNGGTGVTSPTTSPTASAFAAWDANSNLAANAFTPGYATTATAGTTTTLTVASAQQQFFTGTTTQTLQLPVVSTLVLGQRYYIVNNSTGNVTVQSSGGNTIQVMAAASNATFTVISTSGTGAGSWNVEYAAQSSGTVSSVAFAGPGGIFGVSGSPITTTGTITESVTGTSGGVPYFNSTSQLSSSAALTANGVVYGGGAGSAPASTAASDSSHVLVGGTPPSFAASSASGTTGGYTPGAQVGYNGSSTIGSGNVGEIQTATASSLTGADIVTLSPGNGTFTCWGVINYPASATGNNYVTASLYGPGQTGNTGGNYTQNIVVTAQNYQFNSPPLYVNSNSSPVVHLLASVDNTNRTVTGYITCVRIH